MEASALRASWGSAGVASLALLAGGFLVFAAPVILVLVGRLHLCLDYCDGSEPPSRVALGIGAGVLTLLAAVVLMAWAAMRFARRPGRPRLTRGRALVVVALAIAGQIAVAALAVGVSGDGGRPLVGWGVFVLGAAAWVKLTAVGARGMATLGPPAGADGTG